MSQKHYRVTYKTYIDDPNTHQKRYFEHFEEARTYYFHKLLDQTLESALVSYVAFEKKCVDGRYRAMFDSNVYHTCELYGIDRDGNRLAEKPERGGNRHQPGRRKLDFDQEDAAEAGRLFADGDVKGAAALLGVTVNTVHRAVADGRIPIEAR